MQKQSSEEPSLIQTLRWGGLQQERRSYADTMFVSTGRRIYLLGDIDGRFRPRSNPYDLYALGHARPGDPLADKLQGVWAQPVRGFNRYGYTFAWGGETWTLDDARRFTQTFASVQFDYQRGPLAAVRQDFAALDLPLVITTLAVTNTGSAPLDIELIFDCQFDLADAEFTRLGPERNTGQTVELVSDRLVARSRVAPERWAAAAAGLRAPDAARVREGSMGELVYHLHLAPRTEETFVFGLAVECTGGPMAALATVADGLARHSALLAERQALYDHLFARGPHFTSPDPALNAAFELARANLQVLEAEQPELGRYFYAGLELFPFWFSDDGAYSMAGLFACGFTSTALNHIRIGLENLEAQGRVPHQISPSGKVAFSGNAQETPLWVMSIWEAYRWTGDRDFLAAMYPGALKGMFDYTLGTIDPDGDGYPSGPGMVEVEGMGPEKLDTAAYTWSALIALAEMAAVLGDAANAQKARSRADTLAARFDAVWWSQPDGTYAMSLTEPGNVRYPVSHWAVIVPLEVGLATPEHAAQTFTTLRAQYLNRWGLKHTAGKDERVWTLPTVTASRAAYRYGAADFGFDLLRHVAETLDHGSIGLFHELIPEGACFVQLWSGATYLRGVIEDLLGITVDAAEHRVRIAPQLPSGWDSAALDGLAFGDHQINMHVSRDAIAVSQHPGSAPLHVECRLPDGREWYFEA